MSTGETPLGKQLAFPSLPSRSGREVHTAMGEVKKDSGEERRQFFPRCSHSAKEEDEKT